MIAAGLTSSFSSSPSSTKTKRGVQSSSLGARSAARGEKKRSAFSSASSSSSSSSSSSRTSTKSRCCCSGWSKDKTTLIFDLDGVLYPAANGYLDNVRQNQRNYLIEKHGLSEEEARRVRKEAFAKHNQTLKGLRSLGYEVDHDEFTEFVRRGMYEYLSRDERVNETLERLKATVSSKKNGKMVLMTNTAERQARKCLDALSIDERLFEDGIYGSEFMGDAAKPMPEAFQVVCDDIGVSPEECIMFEDSFKNLKTCVSVLGMGGIFISGETLEMELGGGKENDNDARGELNAVANVVVESIGDLFEVCPELFE